MVAQARVAGAFPERPSLTPTEQHKDGSNGAQITTAVPSSAVQGAAIAAVVATPVAVTEPRTGSLTPSLVAYATVGPFETCAPACPARAPVGRVRRAPAPSRMETKDEPRVAGATVAVAGRATRAITGAVAAPGRPETRPQGPAVERRTARLRPTFRARATGVIPDTASAISVTAGPCLVRESVSRPRPRTGKTRTSRSSTATVASLLTVTGAPSGGKVPPATPGTVPGLAFPSDVTGRASRAVVVVRGRAATFLTVVAEVAPRVPDASVTEPGELPPVPMATPVAPRLACAPPRPNGRQGPITISPGLTGRTTGKLANLLAISEPATAINS